MSIPFSIIALIPQISSDESQLINIISQYRLLMFLILICIAFIGFGVFCYIINLRLDVILYARVVNGIRKFFYDKFEEDINLKIPLRILPQSPQLPSYLEKSLFYPVVFVFGLMNSLYFFLSLYVWFNKNIKLGFTIAVIFFLFHFIVYRIYANYRETAYLKSNILGVDIDGVLNKHREHFCQIIKNYIKKDIGPDEILTIPVHECISLSITKEDERKVFNDPKYWTEMPVKENASNRIKTFKNVFKLKIYIFTYRPWPDCEDNDELIEKIKIFYQNSKGFSLLLLLLKIGIRFRIKWLIKKFKEEPLRLITKNWLKENDIVYDKFILEKGNDYSSDPRSIFNNRFFISRKKKIRFFVEDDLDKAIKLSYICDVIFLLSQPYNEPSEKIDSKIKKLRENLPSNIIRVKNWNEIYNYIKSLL